MVLTSSEVYIIYNEEDIRMSKVTIIYKLSEEGRKKSLLSGGDGKETQYLYTEPTIRTLKYATVNADGEAIIMCTKYSKPEVSLGYDRKPYISYSTTSIHFDDVKTVEYILDFLEIQNTKTKELEEKLKSTLEEETRRWEERNKAYEEKKRIQRENEEKERNSKAELKLKLESDKKDWINKYGSEYLKDAYNSGYNCQRKYVEERVSLELPEFLIDFDNDIFLKARSMPSEKALYESLKLKELGYKSDVSWTNSIDDGVELICIYDYLGKYFLYKLVE